MIFMVVFITLTNYKDEQLICKMVLEQGYIGQKVNIGQRSTTEVVFPKFPIFIRLTWNLKIIYISGHWIEPPIIFDVNIYQKVNIGQMPKILNFNPIDLKFEEHMHIRSLNSTTY